MKRLKIPVFDVTVVIYKANEHSKFQKDTGLYDQRDGYIYSARQCANRIYIGKQPKGTDPVGVCYHEASHFADWLIEDRLSMEQDTLWSNTELRAYILEYVGNQVREYCCGDTYTIGE